MLFSGFAKNRKNFRWVLFVCTFGFIAFTFLIVVWWMMSSIILFMPNANIQGFYITGGIHRNNGAFHIVTNYTIDNVVDEDSLKAVLNQELPIGEWINYNNTVFVKEDALIETEHFGIGQVISIDTYALQRGNPQVRNAIIFSYWE